MTARSYQRKGWTRRDDAELCKRWERGDLIEDIADSLGRQRGATKYRAHQHLKLPKRLPDRPRGEDDDSRDPSAPETMRAQTRRWVALMERKWAKT